MLGAQNWHLNIGWTNRAVLLAFAVKYRRHIHFNKQIELIVAIFNIHLHRVLPPVCIDTCKYGGRPSVELHYDWKYKKTFWCDEAQNQHGQIAWYVARGKLFERQFHRSVQFKRLVVNVIEMPHSHQGVTIQQVWRFTAIFGKRKGILQYTSSDYSFSKSSVWLQQWLTDVLKVELSEIEIDMELENIILNELIAEQYQWQVHAFFSVFCLKLTNFIICFSFCHRMVDQYEQTNEVDLSGDRSFIVLCPICQLSELQLISHLLKCQCGFQ